MDRAADPASLGRPQISPRTLYRRVRLVAIWRRPKLTARGDPDHDEVVAGIVARLIDLPHRSVVLAEDETHLNLLPHVRASWTLRGRRPEVLTPGTNRKVTAYLDKHPRLELLHGARYSPHDNPAERIWGALKNYVANTAVSWPARLRQIHSFFRARSPGQMLATALDQPMATAEIRAELLESRSVTHGQPGTPADLRASRLNRCAKPTFGLAKGHGPGS